MVARKNIQTYKYGEKQQKAKNSEQDCIENENFKNLNNGILKFVKIRDFLSGHCFECNLYLVVHSFITNYCKLSMQVLAYDYTSNCC